MKVILLKDIKGLGRIGEVKETSDGYARNFLLPRRMARQATADVLKSLELEQQKLQTQKAAAAAVAAALAKKIAYKAFSFEVPADEKGHLYAGLKESEILAKITKGAWPSGMRISLVNYLPIKQTGEYELKVQADSETVKVKIRVLKAK